MPKLRQLGCSLVRPPDYEDGLESDERTSTFAQARCDDETCRKTWTVAMTGIWPAPEFTLQEAPKTTIRASELHDGWEDEPYPEPNPEPGAYGIFLGGLKSYSPWSASSASRTVPVTVNRMLFVHLYSLMEAYLSGRAHWHRDIDKAVQHKVLAQFTELRTKKLTLDDVLRNPQS